MKTIKPIAIWLGALLAIATALIFAEGDQLWKVQQYNLFLYTSLFFKQTMVVSGGMLSYLGTFFTQFFYHPWMGVVLLCLWWLLLMWLTKRTFRIPDRWNVVALIPVAILLTANMGLGYWIYCMKLHGYFFVSTIGTTAAVALMWLFRLLPQNVWVRCACVAICVLIGYPLMGVYALAASLLMGIWTWRLSGRKTQNAVVSVVALLATVAIPLFYYRYVFSHTNLEDIYLTALPVFTIQETYSAYFVPYYLLAACFLAFTVIKEWKAPKKPMLYWALQGALLTALVAGVWHFWYKDDNFHHELRMQRCLEQTDWEGVVEEGRKQTSEPTRSIVMLRNLALSRLGRQCDEMYNFPKGSKRSNTPIPVYMYNTAGHQINYQYGLLNECHRLCMEEGVEYGWSVETLQYMARCALLGGEKKAARKFLSLLRQTLFYRSWAEHMEEMVGNPGLTLIDKETGPITHMLHYGDIRSEGNGYVEKNLMTMLSQLDADDLYFQEQAVLAAMWTRNPANFWPRFEYYVNLNPNSTVPRIFQEAAYLFASLENLPFLSQLPVDKSVKDGLQEFVTIMKRSQGALTSQTKDYLYQKYGRTYFFEYFFLKDITYY